MCIWYTYLYTFYIFHLFVHIFMICKCHCTKCNKIIYTQCTKLSIFLSPKLIITIQLNLYIFLFFGLFKKPSLRYFHRSLMAFSKQNLYNSYSNTCLSLMWLRTFFISHNLVILCINSVAKPAEWRSMLQEHE